MPASLNQIYQMLGELTGTVKAINEKVDGLGRDMGDSEIKSDASRANMHRRLDEVVMRTTHLETDVLSVKTKLERVETVTNDVVTLRTQAEGVGSVGRWLIRFGIGVITVAGWIVGAYTWLTGRPPP